VSFELCLIGHLNDVFAKKKKYHFSDMIPNKTIFNIGFWKHFSKQKAQIKIKKSFHFHRRMFSKQMLNFLFIYIDKYSIFLKQKKNAFENTIIIIIKLIRVIKKIKNKKREKEKGCSCCVPNG
jgi:hypothetical protein